MHSKRRNK